MENRKKTTMVIVTVIAVIAIAIVVFLLTNNTKTFYTVSFNTDGGNEVVSQEVEAGGKIDKPAEPTKEGYKFLGWYLNGEYFDFTTPVEKDMKLEAKWQTIDVDDKDEKDDKKDETPAVTKYTVTFNSNGGSAVASQTIESGKTATAPTNPTKSGYKFLGWYVGNAKYNFAQKVTKNITLTAKWEKVNDRPVTPVVTKYTVTFNSNGGSTVASQTIENGKTATAPTNPTKSGYTFIGWYYNNTVFNFSTKITSDVVLVAKWEKNAVITYKIENIAASYVGQVKVFVLKDDVKVAGLVDITLSDGTVVKNVDIPATGLTTNGYDLKTVTNVRVK